MNALAKSDKCVPQNSDQSEFEKNNSSFDFKDKDPASDLETYDKSESDKGYGKTESEKGDLKTDSEESELESDRSLIDSDVCEGQIDGEAFGCGDGPCEPNIPEYEDEVKGSVAIRRHRGLQNTGQEGTLLDTEVKEPTFGEYQFQTWPENEENSGLNKENQVRGKKSLSQMTSGDAPVKSDTSVGSWAMYILPKTVCLIVLCMIYVGFMILSVKVLNYSPNKA